jgi:hypothetical protein
MTFVEQCKALRSDYKVEELPSPAANSIRMTGSWVATEGSLVGKKRSTSLEIRATSTPEQKGVAIEQVSRTALRLIQNEASS